MSYDILKILSDSNKDIDNQKLMDYVAGRLSAGEKNEVEQWMADSEFANDAVEGLQQVENKKNIESLVEQLNTDLQKKLEHKKIRKERRKLKDFPWIYFALILVLLLIIATWFVIQRMPARP